MVGPVRVLKCGPQTLTSGLGRVTWRYSGAPVLPGAEVQVFSTGGWTLTATCGTDAQLKLK